MKRYTKEHYLEYLNKRADKLAKKSEKAYKRGKEDLGRKYAIKQDLIEQHIMFIVAELF